MEKDSVITRATTVIVFAYAPAGLGHLRVTEALYSGLPANTSPILLGAHDKTIRFLHRITSIHPIARIIFEFIGTLTLSTILYKFYLRHRTGMLHEELTMILDERLSVPENIILVATHFGLAHQLAKIKPKIARERGVKVELFVQVTDDTHHSMWYVEGASIIFVPSVKTKELFQKFGARFHLKKVDFETVAYPVSPKLTAHLSSDKFLERKEQLDPTSTRKIHVSIPISGAAVGTSFLEDLLSFLHSTDARFFFHATSKKAPYTEKFVFDMEHRPYVSLTTSSHDRGIVDAYEKVYLENTISIEVTKPSEQAFKALCTPKMRGGGILLFASPLGPQEFDNLDFLQRHSLIPSHEDQKALVDLSQKNAPVDMEILARAKSWRGLVLPTDARSSAKFVVWCLNQKVFASMMHYESPPKESFHAQEINSNGVNHFWEKVAEYLKIHVK